MPINELSDIRRLTRDFHVRLGTRKTSDSGREYPVETDFFVLDEAPEDVQAAYKTKPKSLRIMLPFEWNATVPATGEDLVYSLYNRAYGNQKGLKCRGTGRSYESRGTARTNDEEYAKAIKRVSGSLPEKIASRSGETYWTVTCLGRDCPKFMLKVSQPDPNNPNRNIDVLAPDHDRDAACNEIAILRCFLLHPTTDASSPDYCKKLGTMQLSTTSINSIVDLQSGFELVKHFTVGAAGVEGRSAGIPMTLTRKPTITYRPVKQTHYTCIVQFDQREIQRWAAIPMNEVFLSEDQRAKLKELQAAPLGLTVDAVRDLIPRSLQLGVAGAPTTTPEPVRAPDVPTADRPATEPTDGSAALSDTAAAPDGGDPVDPADTPLLVAAQLDELKLLAGGPENPLLPYDKFNNPWKEEAIADLRAAVQAMKESMGITTPLALSELRIGHYDWLKKRLKENA